MNKKLLLFDNDGVLADSFVQVADTIIKLATMNNWPIKTHADVQEMFKNNFFESMREQGVSGKELEGFAAHPIWEDVMHAIDPFAEIPPIIKALAQNNDLYVISSARTDWVESMLNRHHMTAYFNDVLGSDKGLSKVKKMEQVLKTRQHDTENAYYIGDTAGDIHEGNAVGVRTVAVTWGYHPEAVLREANPDYVVQEPSELLTTLSRL